MSQSTTATARRTQRPGWRQLQHLSSDIGHLTAGWFPDIFQLSALGFLLVGVFWCCFHPAVLWGWFEPTQWWQHWCPCHPHSVKKDPNCGGSLLWGFYLFIYWRFLPILLSLLLFHCLRTLMWNRIIQLQNQLSWKGSLKAISPTSLQGTGTPTAPSQPYPLTLSFFRDSRTSSSYLSSWDFTPQKLCWFFSTQSPSLEVFKNM